ncbi:MAG: M28 family peptidase [Chloracidobacterium sp.]|nr:M28 family peptidase [Chloracidobacterium sp.]
MKKQLFSYLLLLSFVFSVSAQRAQVTKPSAVEANLRRHIEYLASDKLEGRRTGEKGAALAAKYIADQFAKVKLKPGALGSNGKASYLQPFSYTPVRDPHGSSPATESSSPAKRRDTANVIGILPGTDPILKNEAIVIGAHYDHLGYGGSGSLATNLTQIHHGADDNASGTAAIIELARQFAGRNPHDSKGAFTNKRTLIFIAFSGEEEGLFGSNFYVNNPVFPLDKTVAMINLDMVGRLNDNKLTIGGIGTASEWKDLTNEKNSLGGTVSSIWTGRNGSKSENSFALGPWNFALQLNEDGFGPSDHSSFYGKKIPVLFFFTGTHNDYHKPSDTAEKINYDGLLSIVNYVQSIAKAVDQNPQRPTYTVAKSSNTGGRTGFNISLGTIPNYGDSTDGMLIDGVRDGSPAAKAGVKAGDKVVKLANRDIKNVMDYTDTLVDMKAGEEYEIVVLRGGEKLTMKIVPIKR